MLTVVHFSHFIMYLDLNSGLRQFERQYRNISVGFAIDLSVTCQCRSTLTITFTLSYLYYTLQFGFAEIPFLGFTFYIYLNF